MALVLFSLVGMMCMACGYDLVLLFIGLPFIVRTVQPVLVEGVSPESDYLLTGRMISQAPDIDGQVYITGVTSVPGATPGLLAQVGFGPTAEPPISWTNWVDAAFNADVGNNDEFVGQLLPEFVERGF